MISAIAIRLHIILPEINTEEREIFSDNDIKKLWGDYDNSGSVITSHMRIDFCEFLFKFEKSVLESVENIKIQIYNIINSL